MAAAKVSFNDLIAVFLPTTVSAYFFCMGFFDNFGIPETISVSDSTYIVMRMLIGFANRLGDPVFVVLSLSYILSILSVYYAYAKFRNYCSIKKLAVGRCRSFGERLTLIADYCVQKRILVSFLILIFSLFWGLIYVRFNSNLVVFNIFELLYQIINKSRDADLLKALYAPLCLHIFLGPSILFLFGSKIWGHGAKSRIAVVTLSIILLYGSYNLGFRNSGNNLNFSTFLLSDSDVNPKPLIWSNEDRLYFANCDGGIKIQGVKDGKTFFIKDLNSYRNSSVCL